MVVGACEDDCAKDDDGDDNNNNEDDEDDGDDNEEEDDDDGCDDKYWAVPTTTMRISSLWRKLVLEPLNSSSKNLTTNSGEEQLASELNARILNASKSSILNWLSKYSNTLANSNAISLIVSLPTTIGECLLSSSDAFIKQSRTKR